jgi:hypothetical protein
MLVQVPTCLQEMALHSKHYPYRVAQAAKSRGRDGLPATPAANSRPSITSIYCPRLFHMPDLKDGIIGYASLKSRQLLGFAYGGKPKPWPTALATDAARSSQGGGF